MFLANKKSCRGCLQLSCLQHQAARGLLTQAQSFHDGAVAVDVVALQVVQKAAALTYQTCQGALGAVVLAVLLHVLRQVLDAVGEQCNLALCAARIGSSLAKLAENLLLLS